MTERRPVIGVVPAYVPEKKTFSIREHYTAAIESAGGVPLLLPLTRNTQIYETLFPLIDGFLLTGGSDINPKRYGMESTSDKLDTITPTREEVECLVLSYAYQYDIPVLGICRGMQMINVFFGGTLYLDLADQFDAQHNGSIESVAHWQDIAYDHPTHFVDIVRASKLASIFETEHLATNSMHHQGIRDVAPLLDPVAYGPDGLVEAVEVRDRTFIMGVQWHPEFFAGDKHMGCIFTSFVTEARHTMQRERTLEAKGISVSHCRTQACRRLHEIPYNMRFQLDDDVRFWQNITFDAAS